MIACDPAKMNRPEVQCGAGRHARRSENAAPAQERQQRRFLGVDGRFPKIQTADIEARGAVGNSLELGETGSLFVEAGQTLIIQAGICRFKIENPEAACMSTAGPWRATEARAKHPARRIRNWYFINALLTGRSSRTHFARWYTPSRN